MTTVQSNPFPRGASRPPQHIFGRSDQLRYLERFTHDVKTAQRSDIVCYLAPPGLGKTCLLKNTRRNLQGQGWLCGYSEASTDPDTAITDLLYDATEALPEEGAGARFRSRIDEFNISAGPVGVGMKLGSQADLTVYAKFTKLLAGIGAMAKRHGTGVALIIDEAHVLPRQNLELLLRAVNRLDELPIALIVAGLPSIPRRMIHGLPDESTPSLIFYSDLRPLSWEHAEQALRVPASDAGVSFQEDALEILLRFAKGNPLTLQMIGSAAWLEACHSAGQQEPYIIEAIHARTAVSSTKSQLTTAVYSPLWSKLTPDEKSVLAALAECEKTQFIVPYERFNMPDFIIFNIPRSMPSLALPPGHIYSPDVIFFERMQMLESAHKEAERIIAGLWEKGIVHFDNFPSVDPGDPASAHPSVEFVVPGFAEFITRIR